MTDEQLIDAFEHGDELDDEQLDRLALLDSRYAAMIEALREEDAIAADVNQHFSI